MKVRENEVWVPADGHRIRSVVISPAGDGPWPGVLLYTDIFQLTESTLRTARRLAADGWPVNVVAPGWIPVERHGVVTAEDSAW